MTSLPPRDRVEQASVPALRRLGRGPVWLLPVAVGVLVALALVLGGRWAAVSLLGVVGLLGWLSYLVWPRLRTGERALRVVVLGAMLTWVAVTLLTA
jgi:hypothetical protein